MALQVNPSNPSLPKNVSNQTEALDDKSKYKASVEFFSTKKLNKKLINSSSEHANIILTNIFKTADYYVYILARNLNGAVSYGDYLVELTNFVNKPGSILKVILEEQPSLESKAYNIIIEAQKKYHERVSIGLIAPGQVIFEDDRKHFTVSDDRMYRLEEDTDNYYATANFNDPLEAANLRNKFESIIYQPLVA